MIYFKNATQERSKRMKKKRFDPFDDLCKMCKIGYTLLNVPHNSDTTQTIKMSANIKNSIIEDTAKQFITPIDREDIITLSLLLHRLNISLTTIPRKTADTSTFFSCLSDIILLITDTLKNNLKTLPEQLSLKNDSISDKFENEYNKLWQPNLSSTVERKNLLKYIFFDKIRKCYDQMNEIVDFLVMAIVKNT